MRPTSSRYRCDNKLKVYSGSPVNSGFYERNLNKAKNLYSNRTTPMKKTEKTTFKYYFATKKEKLNFKQMIKMINNYLNDYERLKKI